MANHIITVGKGKNKREWSLNDAEFAEFESRFEENELIEIPSNETLSEFAKSFKVTFD